MITFENKNKKIAAYIYSFIIFSLLSAISVDNSYCQHKKDNQSTKSILVLFDFQPEFPFIERAKNTILETINQNSDIDIECYFEFMDLINTSDTAILNQLLNLYALKYKNKKIDLLLIQTEEVLEFWVKYHAKTLANKPHMLVYDIEPKYLSPYKDSSYITGIPIQLDYYKSVNWLLKYRSSINEIVVVNGIAKADSDHVNLAPLIELKAKIGQQVKFSNWNNYSLNEITKKASLLPESSIILFLTMFKDTEGKRHRPYDALKRIANVSSVPVIANYSQLAGTGSIGGYVFSIEEASKQATLLALEILKKKNYINFNPENYQSNQFIFDHEALSRYNIPLSALPDNSTLINKQYNLWKKHKGEIITIIIAFVVLVIFIIYLVILSRRLYKTRIALSKLNENLEYEVQHRTEELRTTNEALKKEVEDRKKIERSLVNVNLQLKELNLTKDKFFSIIAHDLRNPFSAILGFVDVIIKELDTLDTSRLNQFLRIIKTQAKNTLDLLENLLSWAKSQTGKISYKPENLSLSDEIKKAITTISSSASIKNIKVDYVPINNTKIYADPNMLRTIFRNLLSNAVKFTNKGGKVTITTSFDIQNKTIVISIEDNGVGMDEDTQNKLFKIDSNITGIGTEKEKGSGLGLILCKSFIDKHNGKIWVESKQGKGSIFKVLLPLNPS